MTKKAAASLLESIHAKIAQDMLDKLEEGKAEARDWAVIVKFLKDNNIDSLPSQDASAATAFSALVAKAQESFAQYEQ